MSLNDYWQKTLAYFGMAHDGYDDYDEYDDYDDHHDRETNARVRDDDDRDDRGSRDRGSRRSYSSRGDDFDDIYSDPGVPSPSRNLRPVGGSGGGRGSSRGVEVSLIIPRSFNDAQDIADKFKRSIPVILNLQTTDTDLSKRLIDFGSGLTYALDGGMSRIADKVFLLTPRNVEVSAEERARLLEKGFFNQY
jgi:cell division inhibitor SepF